jgi:hypothetical protein
MGVTDVDGLTNLMHNSYKGVDYFPKRRTQTAFLTNQDPCHSGKCVAEQLSNTNGGFVSNYAFNNPKDPEVDLVMNYYNGVRRYRCTICRRSFVVSARKRFPGAGMIAIRIAPSGRLNKPSVASATIAGALRADRKSSLPSDMPGLTRP